MSGLLVFLLLVAVLAAVGGFLSARATRAAARAAEAELAKLRAEVEEARKEAVARAAEAKERRDEATALRAEVRDTKKKAFDQQQALKNVAGAAALREEIDKLSGRLAEARAEAAHGSERARSLEAQVRGLEAQLERSARELADARAAAQRNAEPVPQPAPAAAPQPAPADDEKRRLETERADRAEGKLVEARKRIADLEKEIKSARGRLETEKRVFMVQKGELELAADRYAELRRRYDALRRDHDELVEAVRQAAKEDRRLAEGEKPKGGGSGPEDAGSARPEHGRVA